MRYELKYYLTDRDYSLFCNVINEHPAGFTKSYPDRMVNNIYLDSPDLDSWHETQYGLSVRKKYRIRWYGEWENLQSPVLEVKMKANQLGTKETHLLGSASLSTIKDLVDDIKQRYALPDYLAMSSTNSYLRSYFQSHCGLYRITIDRNLNFGSIFFDLLKPEIPSNWSIMELKYDLIDDNDSDWVKQFIPFQRSKFSKYVNSLSVLD